MSSELKPCPFCGASGEDLMMFCDPSEGRDNSGPSRRVQCGGCHVEAPFYDTKDEAVAAWNRRNGQQEALRLLAAEDARNDKIHDLLEAIREQIRLEIEPEHRPEGLFTNIQNAVYAFRGRTRLMNDAAIVGPLGGRKDE